jgi:hypothetical protein
MVILLNDNSKVTQNLRVTRDSKVTKLEQLLSSETSYTFEAKKSRCEQSQDEKHYAGGTMETTSAVLPSQKPIWDVKNLSAKRSPHQQNSRAA